MARIRLTSVKSVIDRPDTQKRTMRALGLRKLNHTVEVEATPQVMGMIRSIQHLVKVENI